MKCKIPEISWHNRDPVLSVDIQLKSNLPDIYRLASGGTDAHVLIWYLRFTCDQDVQLDLAADLSRHQRAVNAVKWSPNGELLASGDDESAIIIWKKKGESEAINILDSTNDQDKEVWLTLKMLRGHMEDVYDLSWAPNSQFLVSGSVDNSAIIWDVHKGKSMAILNEHKGFVQGVAWDPRNQHIATLSTDRNLRIYDVQTKRVLHRISKGALPTPTEHELHNKRVRYFHDDTLQTFFRRMCYTPDGKLLLTPAGVTDYDGATELMHTAYVFSRYSMRQPAIMLPCPEQYAVALRCCPVLFKLRPYNSERNPPVVPLPYRMIFAMATQCSVYFYDTQQRQPFAVISNIHYTRLTDATWSSDGRIVVVSSTDGFCSLITFEDGELGEVYEEAQTVLDAVLINDGNGMTKKSKKQKENQKSTTSENEKTTATVAAREPLIEKTKEVLQKPATPIAFRRKAGVEAEKISERPTDPFKVAMPIAIKRKPGVTEESVGEKLPSTEENIATVIAVRGKPEIIDETRTDEQPITSNVIKSQLNGNNETKIATPIAIKRKANSELTKASNSAAAVQSENKINTSIAIKRKSDIKAESPILKQLKIGEKPSIAIAVRRKVGLKPHTATINLDSDEEELQDMKDSLLSNKDVEATKTESISVKEKPATQNADDVEQRDTIEEISSVEVKSNTEKPATPIAIKKKPESSSKKQDISKNSSVDSKNAVESKNKVEPTNKIEENEPNVINVKALPSDVIIDKEILGSAEKFESPEKKCRPATPISVRRHPRATNSTGRTPTTLSTYFTKMHDANLSPHTTSLQREQEKPSPKSANKRATPIAVRRTPRPLPIAPKPVDSNIAVEVAMDAWPLPLESPVKIAQVKQSPVKGKGAFAGIELTTERTEDIRLVYEDTVEEVVDNVNTDEQPKTTTVTLSIPNNQPPASKTSNECTKEHSKDTPTKPVSVTPKSKTPRRVALKTISTPKSKKKLIN